jgi:hypothetical protein
LFAVVISWCEYGETEKILIAGKEAPKKLQFVEKDRFFYICSAENENFGQ